MSANPQEVQATPAPAKPKREVVTVQMTDGRKIDFGLKQKLDKTIIKADGTDWKPGDPDDQVYAVRLDFSNGQTRTRELDKYPLKRRLLAHGISQKEGDEGAGVDSVDDMVYDIDTLSERLQKGVWSEKREGGVAGVSILATALVEATKQSMEDIRTFLAGLKPAEKEALKASPQLKPIIDRIQAEKASKSTVDSGALLARLGLKAA